MKTFDTILQGSEATEKNAIDYARGMDFSECEIEEYNTKDKKIMVTIDDLMCFFDIQPPTEIIYDGKIHRFKNDGDDNKKDYRETKGSFISGYWIVLNSYMIQLNASIGGKKKTIILKSNESKGSSLFSFSTDINNANHDMFC